MLSLEVKVADVPVTVTLRIRRDGELARADLVRLRRVAPDESQLQVELLKLVHLESIEITLVGSQQSSVLNLNIDMRR